MIELEFLADATYWVVLTLGALQDMKQRRSEPPKERSKILRQPESQVKQMRSLGSIRAGDDVVPWRG